jgi:transposase InsO family protein
MGWKETCALEERFRFLQACQEEDFSFAELCRQFGISRKTGYKWQTRYQAEGLEGLVDQSRAPDRHPNEVLPEVAEQILALRRHHPHWGPAKLRVRLERDAPEIIWPAASTIGEILKRGGLTIPRKHHRKTPPNRSPLSHAMAPNRVWSIDFKGWFRCGDGTRCDPLTISDGYSRFLLRCQGLESMEETEARGVMEACFREYGLPDGIRSDNGEPFASVGIGGLSRLSIWWIELGIEPERIRPGKPQQNGRHERMHRTLKEATAKPPAANLRMQQRVFDRFRQEYNWERPHEALQMQTPGEVYVGSTRPYPSRIATPEYSSEWAVRAVGPCGTMRWGNRKPFMGKALAGKWLGLEPVNEDQWRVWFCAHPLAILDERHCKLRELPSAVDAAGGEGAEK